MHTYTKVIPERIVTLKSTPGHPGMYTHTFPEMTITVAPTLEQVHDYIWGDCGLMLMSWRNGWLCPFDDDVGSKNITCSAGRRQRCMGSIVTISNAPFVDQQSRLLGRVVCYEWANVLSHAYWNIPRQELLELPDNPNLVFQYMTRHILKETGWWAWRNELSLRRQGKPRTRWLQPISIS